jgi:hypothetical protein
MHAKINVVCAFNVQHKIILIESNIGNGGFVLFRSASFAMFKLYYMFSKHVMKNEDLMLTPCTKQLFEVEGKKRSRRLLCICPEAYL